MISFPSFNDYLIIIGVNIGLLNLYHLKRKLNDQNPLSKTIAFILKIIIYTLVTSVLLFWRYRAHHPSLVELDAFVTALDVILAHAVITIPIFFELAFILVLFRSAVCHLMFSLRVGITWPGIRLGEIIANITTILVFIGMVVIYLYFFKVAKEFQLILFGDFDRSLGWNNPTVFRFTNLFNQVEQLVQSLGNNTTIATIVTFFSIASGVLLLFGASAEAVKHISDGFKKEVEKRF